MPWSQSPHEEQIRQPALKAPLVAVALAASMPLLYLVQSRVGDVWVEGLAYRPASLFDGGWWPGLVTAVFVHAGWSHVGMNAVAALAFGAPVARLFKRAAGVLVFLSFYMACGLVALIGYSLVHAQSQDAVIGASGAVFGLMGAGLRLLGRSDGTLRRLRDRRFLAPAGIIMLLNAATGLSGLTPGADGAAVAWEAHAFGFVFGALAIGVWLKIAGPGAAAFDSPDDLRDPPA